MGKILLTLVLYANIFFSQTPALAALTTLSELNKIIDSNGTAGDFFGYSVAVSGDTVVVGAENYACTDGNRCGLVIIYTLNTNNGLFEEAARLTASDATALSYFGKSVAISGDTVVVGAYFNKNGSSYSGSAYIFEKPVSGIWETTAAENAKLTASDGASNDTFGGSVAVSGDTVVVGASGDASFTGSAYVFVKPLSGGWADTTQDTKLTASDAATADLFGQSVAISGDTIVVGAYGDADNGARTGSAYIFEKPLPGGWTATATENAKLTDFDGVTNDNFGRQVAISGDTIIVGVDGKDDGAQNSGSVYIFEKPSSGGWITTAAQNAILTASEGLADDYFGSSVAISGSTIIVGARFSDDNGSVSGSAYAFEKTASTDWAQFAKLTASDAAAGDWFGVSVAISGGIAVVGAHFDDCPDGTLDCGSAYIYEGQATPDPSLSGFSFWNLMLPAIIEGRKHN